MSSLPMDTTAREAHGADGWVSLDAWADEDCITEDEYEAVEPTFVPLDPVTDQADDFAAMMRAQDIPLVHSPADADSLRELLRRPPPSRRPLPKPLPLDE